MDQLAFHFVWTDTVVYIAALGMLVVLHQMRNADKHISLWPRLLQSNTAVVTGIIMCFYILIALLDSIHLTWGTSSEVRSLLDMLLHHIAHPTETSYAAPFAQTLFVKQTLTQASGEISRIYPPVQHGQSVFAMQGFNALTHITMIVLKSAGISLLLGMLLRFKTTLSRAACYTGVSLFFISLVTVWLSQTYHILGTDKIGQDVFYLTVKSIRTGLVIGCLTLLIMLPVATTLGMLAGYVGRWVDDGIQYLYTVISSIPGVLLIASAVLSVQIYLTNHPQALTSLALRADLRLAVLCLILGLTTWPGLCRIIRAETLKLRELEYIHAAKILNVPTLNILVKHILPNVFHLILITLILDFSVLVLAEAVLSYVGVGVDPTTISWGNMINSARLEFARVPTVWWPLCAAFIGMFTLVLCVNLFADCLRDAHDPRGV